MSVALFYLPIKITLYVEKAISYITCFNQQRNKYLLIMIIKRAFHPVKPGGQLVGPAKEPCGIKNNFSLGGRREVHFPEYQASLVKFLYIFILFFGVTCS